jgi:histidyl-tRNA synthetase
VTRGKIEAPRGTHDIVPAEQPLWQRVTGEAERLCALYGYRPIQTPVFEDTDLFQRTSGAGSDVVQKEMYTFTDRSDRSLTLRPEGTAPICRAYLTHGLQQEPQPQKLYTIAPMYRYGRPGKGRYREHWQLSVEALGSDDPALDAELIHLYDTLLRNLGVTEYHLELNSIGDRNCRPAYVEALTAWLAGREDELDADTREKLRTSPLRALDNLAAKPPHVQEVLREAPAIGDSLCDACVAHFATVRSLLDDVEVAYTLVPTLVRGLDYYTRTTWEFIGPLEGANSTISGGGRYDGLIEEIGGPATPGVGFGAGIERLLIALEAGGIEVEPSRVDVFVAVEPGAPRGLALRWLKELRDAGVAADTDYAGRSLKGQLTQAGRVGAATTVIVGAEGATLRRPGRPDEALAHADVVGTLLR